MRVVGLIGGIGSGKSEASSLLASMGAAVIDADKVGHGVYEPGTRGFDAVVDGFGAEVVGADGMVDRKKLGARVFSEPGQLERLNAIVHPLIRDEIERRLASARDGGETRLAVVEAAILLEAGWRDIVDEVWVVTAAPQTVRARLAESRGLTAEEVAARVAKQMPDAERRAAADVVIENDGQREDLRRRLDELWAARIAR
ncbi:MAG: dephospho-CoA kinase [Candidatus Binatia bacterium]|nr:dephospho-CoA kinase [Candidatus Binatia bacterium]